MRRLSTSGRFALVLSLFAFGSLASSASAKGSFVNVWLGLYPNSESLANVDNGTGLACQFCHVETGGDEPWNAYGWEIRKGLSNGLTITDAILAAEGVDSDQDPTGSTNLEEIDADTQPGWTDGNNNTSYYANGSTDVNQPPVSGILGELDPGCGTTYCGPSQNPANVASIAIDTCDSASPSISLSLASGPPNQFVYLLVGNGNGTVSQPPGAKGDLCVVGGSCLGRYDKDVGQISASGTFALDIQNAISNPCAGAVNIAPGATWNFQFWHRQPMGQPATFSEAISVTFS